MNTIVANWRGIHRQADMTPSEFAGYLVSTDLPGDAVFNLTASLRKFVMDKNIHTGEYIQEAVVCLTAIVDFCQGE